MSAVLVLGALYLLVIDRTGHEQATIDRVMRVLAAAMLIAGVVMAPAVQVGVAAAGGSTEHLAWQPYDAAAVEAAVAGGGPIILDFYADWCAPCRELDEKTFAAPEVSAVLGGYARFKVDLTRSSTENQTLATEYRVMGVPTVIVFSGGEEIFRITGFEPPAQFLARLQAVP
jgi:thiol:disulfide interchange protein DsbD